MAWNKGLFCSSGRSVLAKVVDECDSVAGCDEEHNFEPPCANNIVDGSPAVWKALGLKQSLERSRSLGPMSEPRNAH